ncbi:MAG: zf-HC2 domain-containing protein [Gemmatimonadetes bacterium]|nr:zf-HC2 domain-containing protein [Gemmatimonadota bacterium]
MRSEDDNDSVFEDRLREPAGECARIRDLLPLYVAQGSASPGFAGEELAEEDRAGVAEHLVRCADCREEARFIAELRARRPEPPASLLSSILEAARKAPGRQKSTLLPRLLRAAAVAALALGIGTFWQREPEPEPMWTVALEAQPAVDWYGQDWLVAGEPIVEALPDDMLRMLVEEMEP